MQGFCCWPQIIGEKNSVEEVLQGLVHHAPVDVAIKFLTC